MVQSHITIFYKELLKLAEEELEKKQRKRLRAEKDFKRLVKKYIDRGKLNPTPTFEEVLYSLYLLYLRRALLVPHIHTLATFTGSYAHVCAYLCVNVCTFLYISIFQDAHTHKPKP